MALPIEIKNVEQGQIPANGTAEKKIGNKTGLIWSIPGTSGRQLTLIFSAGYQGNKNNDIEIEIFRGESIDTGRKIKEISETTEFNRQIVLPAEGGMVHLRIYSKKTGGMFGGIFERHWPGIPGVTGKTAIKVETGTELTDPGESTTDINLNDLFGNKTPNRQVQTTYAASNNPVDWLESHPMISIGGLIAVTLLITQ